MLILSFAYHDYQFDACQQGLRSSERTKSQHRPCPSFGISVILLNQVIQIFILSDSDDFFIGFVGIEHGQRRSISATFIDGHHFRFIVVPNGLAEKAQCDCRIPLCGQQEVDGLACSIDCPVQILPLTFDSELPLNATQPPKAMISRSRQVAYLRTERLRLSAAEQFYLLAA